ncbi:GNAT family N-acetyltransferase [Paenibacillus camerounensis]|uniref:GNAT family N-acetyltransferase n=1 Tax=Paenibacillus camerounensis TaxID=1243663 RepID=UPI0005A7E3E5|nr:GNAT family N-acetyltransferase [Paenibacillus camerounensis]
MYKNIEEISLNTWPAEQSVLLDGWILRTASGYTKRSNSVNPLYGPEGHAGSLEVQQKIRLAEHYYGQAELQTVFKITPYSRPAGLDHLLSELGYREDSPSSVRMLELEQLPPVQSRHTLVIRERLEEEWIEAFSQQTGLSGAQRSTLCRMLGASSLQHGYALLYKDGELAACGLGIIQHGYIGLYDIVTAPGYRRQGLAEELILGLLQWGQAQGATASFLQVVLANAAASALYDKLGYKEIYQYWYRVRD